jgi:diguanylate cyclase (GGDEF)-like protein/PAS domain S-box-containing protein
VGTDLGDILHPGDLPEIDDRLEGLFSGTTSAEPLSDVLLRVRRGDGSYAWMRGTASVLLDGDGLRAGVVGGFSDVDDLVAARNTLRRDAFRSQLVIDALLDPHIVLRPARDEAGGIVDFVYDEVNRAGCAYLGATRGEIVGQPVATFLPGIVPTGLVDLCVVAMESGDPLVLEDFPYRQPEAGGADRHFEIRAIRVDDSLSVIWRDMTDRHVALQALAASEEQYRLLAENSSDVVVHGRDGIITWVSPSLTASLGWLPAEWVGRTYVDLLHPDDLAQFTSDRADLATGHSPVHRYRLLDRDQRYHWVEEHPRTYLDAQGNPDGIVGSFRTIDAEVAAQDELAHRAQHDALTGLLNRREILDRISSRGRRQTRSGTHSAVLFCDVDLLKSVNDTYGHAAGDELLRVIAARINSCIRRDDVAARVGGDEILVLLHGVHSLKDAADIAEKIRRSGQEPIRVGADAVRVSLSVGVTLARDDDPVEVVVARADRAMYQAKQEGRNRVVVTGSDEAACDVGPGG